MGIRFETGDGSYSGETVFPNYKPIKGLKLYNDCLPKDTPTLLIGLKTDEDLGLKRKDGARGRYVVDADVVVPEEKISLIIQKIQNLI